MAAPAAAAPQEQLLAADSVMSVVRLQVGAPEAVEGTVLAVDAGARLVVLECAGGEGKTMALINADAVTGVEVVRRREGAPSLQPLNAEFLAKKFAAADKARREDAARINVNVPPWAQALFDALANMFPCHWRGTDMVVADTVTVKPPYAPANCVGDKASAVELVRNRLASARDKLKL